MNSVDTIRECLTLPQLSIDAASETEIDWDLVEPDLRGTEALTHPGRAF